MTYLLEARLGKQLLGKKREPLNVQTMQQAARRTGIEKGRERVQRLAAKRPVYGASLGEKRRAERQRDKERRQAVASSTNQSTLGKSQSPYTASSSSDTRRHPNELLAKAALAAGKAGAESRGAAMGTAPYMSPEQVRGETDTPNPDFPKIRGGGAKRQSQKLARHAGISSVACKDPSGRTYTSSRGCSKGHAQLGSRVSPAIRPAKTTAPQPPSVVRTQAAMKRAGVRQRAI
jgi:hypothetical protein